jgi:hypothetical protein
VNCAHLLTRSRRRAAHAVSLSNPERLAKFLALAAEREATRLCVTVEVVVGIERPTPPAIDDASAVASASFQKPRIRLSHLATISPAMPRCTSLLSSFHSCNSAKGSDGHGPSSQ